MEFSFPWWFYALFAVPIVWPLIQRLVQEIIDERRFARAGLSDIRRMSWRDFEKYLAHLFRSLGYQTEVTPPSGDYGVDVILTDGSGRRIAVQAKRWKGKKVGAPEIQKTIGGAAYYKCQQAIVVTTSGYTDQAQEMARKTGVQLWGLKELGDAMELARSRGAGTQPASATQPAPKPSATAEGPKPVGAPARPLGLPVKPGTATGNPACPKCGAHMVERTAQGTAIWLCSRFPACQGNLLKK
ncbi:MAG TPA: restriction endonuclease [Symbiobacteriaceae bacterium]|nr:restriction endonuclease [Symbiobacteriaceae bacterium]